MRGEIERFARRQRMNVSKWVQLALRQARSSEPAVEAGRKLEVVRSAVGHEFPTANIEQMLREIEHGCLGDTR